MCILKENLCNWSYGTCSHANLIFENTCSNIDQCQCDRGYQLRKVIEKENTNFLSIDFPKDRNDTSCIIQTNRSFDIMLNPRISFYLNQHGSGFVVS